MELKLQNVIAPQNDSRGVKDVGDSLKVVGIIAGMMQEWLLVAFHYYFLERSLLNGSKIVISCRNLQKKLRKPHLHTPVTAPEQLHTLVTAPSQLHSPVTAPE